MKILFVENHPVFAKTVTTKFLANHQVSTVSSIAGAWSAITAGSFDVVLVDYDLDDGKGDELARRIRSHRLPVKIVGVSSHEGGNAAIQQAGADAICSKMEFSDIGSILRRLVPA